MPTVALKITNCLDCPHHREFRDPGSDDPYDMADTSIGCALTEGHEKPGWWNTKGMRIISACERWGHRKYCDVPTWCPLLVKKAEPKKKVLKRRRSE